MSLCFPTYNTALGICSQPLPVAGQDGSLVLALFPQSASPPSQAAAPRGRRSHCCFGSCWTKSLYYPVENCQGRWACTGPTHNILSFSYLTVHKTEVETTLKCVHCVVHTHTHTTCQYLFSWKCLQFPLPGAPADCRRWSRQKRSYYFSLIPLPPKWRCS